MKLISYGGDGFGGCTPTGDYTVKYGDDKEKTFTNFDKAYEFYESLNEAKAFWDNKHCELLDGYILVPDDYQEDDDN